MINPGVVGTIDDIPALAAAMRVDRVVVGLPDERGALPMDRLLDVRMRTGVMFDHLASVYGSTGKIALENLRPSWLVFSTGFRKTRALMAASASVDVVASLVGLILASPLMLVAAVLVKIDAPRSPILYHQQRVGLNGKIFTIHKFRTMRPDAEAGTGAVWSTANDTRVTAVGRFMRKTRLDEIPQLWNVLRGDMALIGPRPERPEFRRAADPPDSVLWAATRDEARRDGLGALRYSYGASVGDALEKMQYDLYYVKHVSLMFDLMIVLETVKTVVLRRGAR